MRCLLSWAGRTLVDATFHMLSEMAIISDSRILRLWRQPMNRPALRIAILGLVAASLAACATAPAPQGDLTPPARKPYDAKTQLESGRR
jgi:hypothetical protein